MEFSGAKLALFLGQELLVILRDDRPDIPYPGHWDLPGGGREGDETPQACVLRETQEEVGLKLTENDLGWSPLTERASSPCGFALSWSRPPTCVYGLPVNCS